MCNAAGCVVLATVFLVTTVLAALQTRSGEQAIKLETDLVVVDATVTDKNGNFIRNLKQDDFTLYVDGAPQKLDFFEASEVAALTRPIAVVFALDISGSIKPEEVTKQREATESFMRLVRSDSVFSVMTFNDQIRVLQDFTSDPKKINRAFSKAGEMTGSTRLFAAIGEAITLLKRAPRFRDGRRLRRVMVVVTDGYGSDGFDADALVQRAQDAETTVYSITLPSYSAGLGAGQRVMTLLDAARIVPLTGGADFSADARDFTPVFKAIAEEIKASYTFGYYPPQRILRDGRVHQIRIEVKRSGAIVRASRTSYKAPGKKR